MAAGVAAAPINAGNTVQAGGGGGLSVFAGFVIADKGEPFKLIRVTKQNWQNVLGRPLRPSAGAHAASLRCLEEALKGGDGYVVRVVPATAKFPVITVQAVDAESGKNVTAASASSYGATITLGVSDLLAFYPIDGSASLRSIELTPIPSLSGQFKLSAYATDALGNEFLENSWTVSMSRTATDEDGKSLYISDVLSRTNAFIRVAVSEAQTLTTSIAGVVKTPFVGATSGNAADISQAEWDKASNVLSSALVGFTAVVGLGITDAAVIEKLADIATARRIDMFADISANSYAAAVSAVKASGFNYENLCLYFFPYKTKDAHYGVHAHWGISGIAFAAKAAGIAMTEGAVGGFHYSPAGETRGIIGRKEPLPFDGLDAPDEEAMYKARLNKIGLSSGGLLMIDDAITTRQKDDYLVYQHVSSVMNSITRGFYSLSKTLQHEPDGVTYDGLMGGMKSMLDNYVAATALVPPRNPDEDGEEPYIITVEQAGFDHWVVKWACCVTGTSRRIIGQPAILR